MKRLNFSVFVINSQHPHPFGKQKQTKKNPQSCDRKSPNNDAKLHLISQLAYSNLRSSWANERWAERCGKEAWNNSPSPQRKYSRISAGSRSVFVNGRRDSERYYGGTRKGCAQNLLTANKLGCLLLFCFHTSNSAGCLYLSLLLSKSDN